MTTQSDHLLNFILVVSDSTSQSVALVDSELVCLRPVAILKVVVIVLFCCVSLALKNPYGGEVN